MFPTLFVHLGEIHLQRDDAHGINDIQQPFVFEGGPLHGFAVNAPVCGKFHQYRLTDRLRKAMVRIRLPGDARIAAVQ